jgi:predicted MFS family arabinose efflux permease
MAVRLSRRVRSRPRLWRATDFTKFWLGQTVSAFGSHITGTALPLAALLALNASALQIGVLTMLGTLPMLLVGLPAGAWVDRLPRRPILIAADLGRAALLLSIPVAFALRRLRIEQLYLVTLLTGALTVFAEVAGPAFLVAMLPPTELVAGNSRLSTGDAVAEIGGPSLAGVLVQVIRAPFAIAFDVLSFLFSAGCLLRISAPEPSSVRETERASLAREIAEGVRLVMTSPILRALAGCMGTFTFFGYFIGTLYALFAIRVLHLAPALVGVLVGLGGVSSLVGSLVAPRVLRWGGVGPVLIGTKLFSAATTLLIPLAGGPPAVAVLCMAASQLFGDAVLTIYFIAQASLRQAAIPPHLLGRALASMQVLERGAAPLGALLAGLLAQAISPRFSLWIGVLGGLAAVLWLVFSPIRHIHQLGERDEGKA